MIANVTVAHGHVARTGQKHRVVRLRAVLVGLLLGVLALLAGPATPAAAHAELVSSSPAPNSVVASAPNQVVLSFTEGVTPINDRVHVIAPDGSKADTGEARSSGDQLIIPLKPGLPTGTFLVNYRVLSTDSHPVGGAFSYSVGAPSPGGAPAASDQTQSTSQLVETLFPAARWIGYVGLLLFVGAVMTLALLWPRRLDRRDPIRMIWLGAGMIGLSAVFELALQVPYVAGGFGSVRAVDVRAVISSQYGAAHLVRLGALAAAALLVRPVVRGRGWGADRVLLAVLGTIMVATWSVSGHPSATAVPLVTVVADMIHISAMSVWLGGLVMLVVFLLRRASARELAAIIPVWSRWAAYAVSTLVLTGMAQALIEVRPLSALVSTTYGWLLLAKVGVVAIVVAVASQSRRLVPVIASVMDRPAEVASSDDPDEATEAVAPSYARAVATTRSGVVLSVVEGGASGSSRRTPPPAEDDAADVDHDADDNGAYDNDDDDNGAYDNGDDDNGADDNRDDDIDDGGAGDRREDERGAGRRLRGLVLVEALLAVVILGVTSVLVQTTPARSAAARPANTATVQSATMTDKLFTLSVDLQPGKVGINDVHLYATTPDGQPAKVQAWTVRASAPELGIEPIDANILGITPEHALGTISIPKAGTWTFSFTLRTGELDESTVVTQIEVAP